MANTTDVVFNFAAIWKDIHIQTGSRSASFAKYIRSMCQGERELEEKYKDVIQSLSWDIYMGNFSYWYGWRSFHDNKDMWPKFGVNETNKKKFAKEILKKFCPIASEFWIKKALAKEARVRAESRERTEQLISALNDI
jgi:hypothetical protein